MTRRPNTSTSQRRRGIVLAIAAALPLLAFFAAPGAAGAAGPQIFRDAATFPNYWWDDRHQYIKNSDEQAASVSVVSDPLRHLVIEVNPITQASEGVSGQIPNVVVYDAVSEKVVSSGYLAGAGTGASSFTGASGENGKSFMGDYDETDAVLLLVSPPDSTVRMYAVPSLRPVGKLTVPAATSDVQGAATGSATFVGVSWSALHDEMLVSLTSQPFSDGFLRPQGVEVLDYDLSAILTKHASTPVWTDQVSECSAPLVQVFATAVAHRSVLTDSVYVPCELASYVASQGQANTERSGVVKIGLSRQHSATSASPTADIVVCNDPTALCPEGSPQVAVTPGLSQDFIFDPVSDRGLMPTQNYTTGVDLLVYDGTLGAVMGKANVGDVADYNNVSFGVDALRGRVYAIGIDDGLTTVDVRRTPVNPGNGRIASIKGQVSYLLLSALPPDPVHPSTRLLVPFQQDTHTDANCPQCHTEDFTVIDDASEVTQDPPASHVDDSTYSGPIPAGASATHTYSGAAMAYGIHADFVGGPSSIQANLIAATGGKTTAIPFGSTSDLFGGSVEGLRIGDGSTLGTAAAISDGNGQASSNVQECTDVFALAGCAPPPQCPSSVPCPAVPESPVDQSTGQLWPFPDASCTNGEGNTTDQTSAGLYLTKPYASTDKPEQDAVPGTDSLAHAEVHCTAQAPVPGSATGLGTAHALNLAQAGLPGVSIAGAFASASVSPPAKDGQPTSTSVDARVEGLHIDLGSGNSIDIGGISQHATTAAAGVPDSARTAQSVVMDHVVITQSGQAEELCAAVCPDLQQVVDQINAAFPTLVHVMQPAPDSQFGTSDRGNGSPGGYEAVVQANFTEQQGDQKFNLMSPTESTFLPALRIVVYGFNDGSPALSRLVLDAAGVEADSENSLSVLAPPLPFVDDISTAAEAAAAGLPPSFVPGSPGSPGTPGAIGGPQANGGNYGPGIVGVARRVLAGFRWLVHSPMEILTLLATFVLLGTPLILIARRRLWLIDLSGDS